MALGLLRGVQNLRKAAAYTREAVLDLGARKLGVAREALAIKDGVITGGGKSATYGALVAGQDLQLTIPVRGDLTAFMGLQVTGTPPLKPTTAYTVVGQPVKNPIIPAKVKGETLWVGDVKLPGMLHARVVHPPTLGSTLVSAGKVDRAQFKTAKVVVIGAGVSGMNSAAIALGMQAEVLLLDNNIARLRQMDAIYQGHMQTVASNAYEIERAVRGDGQVEGGWSHDEHGEALWEGVISTIWPCNFYNLGW